MNQFLLGLAVMGLSVAIHLIGGFSLLLALDRRFGDIRARSLSFVVTMLVLLFAGLLTLHIAQMGLWALLYQWKIGWDLETAMYFSAVTYATIGYGDVVPPAGWRLSAAIEGLTGVLMLGWSSALIFVAVNRIYTGRVRPPG